MLTIQYDKIPFGMRMSFTVPNAITGFCLNEVPELKKDGHTWVAPQTPKTMELVAQIARVSLDPQETSDG